MAIPGKDDCLSIVPSLGCVNDLREDRGNRGRGKERERESQKIRYPVILVLVLMSWKTGRGENPFIVQKVTQSQLVNCGSGIGILCTTR